MKCKSVMLCKNFPALLCDLSRRSFIIFAMGCALADWAVVGKDFSNMQVSFYTTLYNQAKSEVQPHAVYNLSHGMSYPDHATDTAQTLSIPKAPYPLFIVKFFVICTENFRFMGR